MQKRVYIIEGLDRLGKSTLIENIQQKFGFYQVIHYQKPKILDRYVEDMPGKEAWTYQTESFVSMFQLIESCSRLILDRAHLGECVYAPMYRKYDGDYVFDLEKSFGMELEDDVRLILLTEDFDRSKHFVDDGLSLGSADKRAHEQRLFIDAFNKSIFPDKKIICVTDPITGKFRSQEDILKEATE